MAYNSHTNAYAIGSRWKHLLGLMLSDGTCWHKGFLVIALVFGFGFAYGFGFVSRLLYPAFELCIGSVLCLIHFELLDQLTSWTRQRQEDVIRT